MADEWSPVFEHDGKGCPCVGSFVRCWGELYGGFLVGPSEGRAEGGPPWDWSKFGGVHEPTGTIVGKILRYQIRRPPSVQKMIDKAEGLPVKRKERV